MPKNVHAKVSAAARQLCRDDAGQPGGFEAVLAHLGRTLRGMEISEAAIARCRERIRAQVEATRALNRPHPQATLCAIMLDVLQAENETAVLFPQLSGAGAERRAWPAWHAWPRLDFAGVPRIRHRAPAPQPILSRRVDRELLRSMREFKPAPLHMDMRAGHLDPRSIQRHLWQVRRHHPDPGLEPPRSGSPAL